MVHPTSLWVRVLPSPYPAKEYPPYSLRSLQNALLANFGRLQMSFCSILVAFGALWADFGRLLDVLWSTLVAFGRHWAPKVAQRAKKLKIPGPTFAFWTPKMDTKTFISYWYLLYKPHIGHVAFPDTTFVACSTQEPLVLEG